MLIAFLVLLEGGFWVPKSVANSGDDLEGSAESEPLSSIYQKFSRTLQQDFPLRNIGNFRVTNRRGTIILKSWSQNKIRAVAKGVAFALNPDQAEELFSSIDLRFREIGENTELSVQHGKGLEIDRKLKERGSPRTWVDLEVYAPPSLSVKIWTVNGKVSVETWRKGISVRTFSGEIHLKQIQGDLDLTCVSCPIDLEEIEGNIRVIGGEGAVSLDGVRSSQVFVETSSGEQQIQRVSGRQTYVSHSGEITASKLSGHIEFRSQSGNIQLSDVEGFVSGESDSGNIGVSVRKWVFDDRAWFESGAGNIDLELPKGFSAEVRINAVEGETRLEFPVQHSRQQRDRADSKEKTWITHLKSLLRWKEPKKAAVENAQDSNWIQGRVGKGGGELRVFSQAGNIRLRKRL